MGFKEDMQQIAINGIDISKIKTDRTSLKASLLRYLEKNLDKGMLPYQDGDEIRYDHKFQMGDVAALFDEDHVSFIKVYGDIIDYDRASTFIVNVALFLGEQIIKDIEWN